MVKMLYVILLLLTYSSSLAEFVKSYHHSNKILNLRVFANSYCFTGAGPLLGSFDLNGDIQELLKSSNPDIYLTSLHEYNKMLTMLQINYANNKIIILETKNLKQIDTVFYGQVEFTPYHIFPIEDYFLLSALNKFTGEICIYKLKNGSSTKVEVKKTQDNIATDFQRLSNSKIIALGPGVKTSSLFISQDNGNSFDEIDVDFPMLKDLTVCEGVLYAIGAKGHVIKSADDGDNWDILYENKIYDLDGRLQVINQDTIYGCSSVEGKHGVLFRTTNGGDSWEDVYQLEDERFTCFLIDANKAFIGTYSGKILYNDNFTSVQDWKVIEPNSLKVFPNPSTDYLTIDTKEEIESFKIVDIVGNDLSSKVKMEGKTLDLTALASGTYTLIIDGKTAQITVNR